MKGLWVRSLVVILLWGAAGNWISAEDQLQVGYVSLTPVPGAPAPVGAALFSYTNNSGVLISQAGVGITEPTLSGRAFVDEVSAKTGLALVNPSTQAASVSLILRDASGVEFARRNITLSARQHLSQYVDQLFPTRPENFTGSVTFESTQPLSAITLRESQNAFKEPLYSTIPVVDSSSAGSTQPAVFPHIAVGGGYTTQVLLINPSSRAMRGRITFVASNGQPLLVRTQPTSALIIDVAYDIPAQGAYRQEFDGQPGVAAGYALATPDAGNETPSGTAIFRFKKGNDLVTEAGAAATPPTLAARILVDYIGTKTTLAVANAENVDANLTLTLMDRFGFPQSTIQQTLQARNHSAKYVGELFPIEDGYAGMLEIRSSSPIVAITLKLTGNTRQEDVLTTLPIADLTRAAPPGPAVFPHIAIGGGFATRLLLLNTATSSANGQMQFRRDDGSALIVPIAGQVTSDFAYAVAPGAGRQLYPGNPAAAAGVSLIDASSNGITKELVINEGNTVHPRLLITDSSGARRDDFDVTVTSLDTTVAEPDQWGNVSGRAAGFSTLVLKVGDVVIDATATVVKVEPGVAGYETAGIAQDQARRIYLASSTNHVILRADDLKQLPAVYAGTLQSPGLLDDLRQQSKFDQPSFVALNKADGSLYVSDTANNVIRRVAPGAGGRVETLTVADGSSPLNSPKGIALDSRGYLWIADSGSHTIRRMNLVTGSIETIAGQSGVPGLSDGTGLTARFNSPAGLAVETETEDQQRKRQRDNLPAPPVRVIVADSRNNVLRRVTDTGDVKTIGGTGTTTVVSAVRLATPVGVALDPFGNVYVSEPATNRVKVVFPEGEVAAASQDNTFDHPNGVAISQAGRILVADQNYAAQEIRYGQPQISRVTPDRVSSQGGTEVVIDGSNFAPDSAVIAGGAIISPVTVESTGRIRFKTPSQPALPSGITTLTVQNRGGLAQTALHVETISFSSLPRGYVTTVAGGSTFIGDGAPAVSAAITPRGIALDADGNLFIADTNNSRVRRVDARTGVITTVAGNGESGYSGDGASALLAALDFPAAVAVDRSGNLIIGEFWHGRIRRVDAKTGNIQTIVNQSMSDDTGMPLLVNGGYFFTPSAITVDASNNIFVTDSFGRRVFKIEAGTDAIKRIAGNTQQGVSGDGGSARNATFDNPQGVAVDKARNVFVADYYGRRVRRIDAQTGIISTIAGTGADGSCQNGAAAYTCPLNAPDALALDQDGNLLITVAARVRKLTFSTGQLTDVVGYSDWDGRLTGLGGPATIATLSPGKTALDAAGNLYVIHGAGYPGSRVLRIDVRTRVLTSVAGNGSEAILGDGGPATSATILSPARIQFDAGGNLFTGDSVGYFSRVRRVDSRTGVITTAYGCGRLDCPFDGVSATEALLTNPEGMVFDLQGNMYVAHDNCCVHKIDPATHLLTLVAGGGSPADGIGDGGSATSATIRPTILAIDQQGGRNYLYITDRRAGLPEGWNRVRRLDLDTGKIVTVVGNSIIGNTGDGGLAVNASLRPVQGMVVDNAGNLFIAFIGDYPEGGIRRVDFASQRISTIAGGGGNTANNIPATDAQLFPKALAMDGSGRLFFYDSRRQGVLTLDSNNRLVPIAGTPYDTGFAGDNGPATSALFHEVTSLAFDAAGNLYIADNNNNRIRAIRGPIP